ncbi:helix-hairpin-helix domain-containing protein [bacterium]|nr:helix-hairpin-helix domain-containing protein [bacterium]
MRFSTLHMVVITVCVFCLGSLGFYYLQGRSRQGPVRIDHDPTAQITTVKSDLPDTTQFPLSGEKTGQSEESGFPAGFSETEAAQTITPMHFTTMPASRNGRLDLNSVSADILVQKTGMSPELADAIVYYREEGHPYTSDQELLSIPGMTPALMDTLLAHFFYNAPSPSVEEKPNRQDNPKPISSTAGDQADQPGQSDIRININTANAHELQRLPRIGLKTAERIIAYRQSHGLFASPEQIMKVKGVGPKTYEKIKHMITVSN